MSRKDINSSENVNQEKLIKKIPKGYDHTTLYNLKLENVKTLTIRNGYITNEACKMLLNLNYYS